MAARRLRVFAHDLAVDLVERFGQGRAQPVADAHLPPDVDVAQAARGQERVERGVGQAGAGHRTAGREHEVNGQTELTAGNQGRVLTEDLGKGAQAGLVAAEDGQTLRAGLNDLGGFVGAVDGRGRGRLRGSAIVEFARLLAGAARGAAAHVGGRLPAGRVILGADLLVGVFGHVVALLVRFRFCFRVLADVCGGVIVGVVVGVVVDRPILVGLSAFLRAGLLMVGELARVLVLAVLRRGSLSGLGKVGLGNVLGVRVGVALVGILSVGLGILSIIRVLSAVRVVRFDKFGRVLAAILGNRIALDALVGLDVIVASVRLGSLVLVLSAGLVDRGPLIRGGVHAFLG